MTEYETMWYGESMWRDRAVWSMMFCWFPVKCHITKRFMWLKMAYCGTLMFHGPGEPVTDFRWHDPEQHLIWLLKS